jgi:tripartite-type tricarboxylate transporter receptor subunit TctC
MRGCVALLCAALVAASHSAGAQTWPAKPVRMIAAVGPGLATDIVCRFLSDRLSRALGQSFVVENLPGAAGNIGASAAARAAPDGYTFFFATGGPLVNNLYTFKSLPYDPVRDFTPVAPVTEGGGFIISVNNELPAKTLSELLALARAQPGKMAYGVDSSSGLAAIVARLVNRRAGTQMLEVPYKSTSQLVQDTVAGRTQVAVTSLPVVQPFAKAGKLRMLAGSGARRTPGAEEVPPIAETIPDIDIGGFFVVVAPVATPAPIAQRLNREIDTVLGDPQAVSYLASIGQSVSKRGPPEAVGEFLRQQRILWAVIYKDLGIEPQ